MPNYPTLLDIAVANGSDMTVGLIDECTQLIPEITMGAARTIKGTNYKTLVRTKLPQSSFRAANTGAIVDRGTYENRLIETYILNPRWEADKAVADGYEDGAAAYITMEASGIMESSMQTLARQFYYGTTNDPLGFPGVLAVVDPSQVINAAGTTANTASSVWAVKFGPKAVQWVYGQNGQLAMSDVQEQRILDANGNPYTGYVQELLAYVGLQVGSWRFIAQIKNVTADAGCTLTDHLLSQMLATFQAGIVPDAIFMSRRSAEQLRSSRTTYNPMGYPAPFPQEAFGIPIKVTQAISVTEALA